MLARVYRTLKNEPFQAILLIFLITLVTYGINIARLGYYHDDWYVLWSGQARGAQSMVSLFSTDRPFMGVLYSLVYRLLGDLIINWHLYALAWRFIGALAFFWILRLVWPEHKSITTLMVVLFLVYPGFLSIPNANTKQNHLFGFASALLSIAFMLKALKLERGFWKVLLIISSFLLTVNYLFVYEYMLGLEGMRLCLLTYTLYRNGNHDFLSAFWDIIKRWSIHAFALILFVYWRLFIFSGSRNSTDAVKLAGNYLADTRNMLLRIFFETGKDMLDTGIYAWFVKPYELFSKAEYSILTAAFGVSLIVIALLFVYSRLVKINPNEIFSSKHEKFIRDLLVIGAITMFCAILPVVLTGRNVDLTDSYKSYGLHPEAGVVMLVVGLTLMLQPRFRKVILFVLIGLSVMTQQLNAGEWQKLWDYQRQTWWQLTWRAPDIQNDTMVMTYFPDGFRLQQDYEIWGPVNLIYRPGAAKAPSIQSEVLTTDTAYDVLKKTVRDNVDRDIRLHRDFGNLLLMSLPSDNSCMHIIDGKLPVYSENDELIVRQVGSYSKIDRIIPTGASQQPSPRIFGAEPAHSWCYYYQKASLARQTGNWDEIGKIFDETMKLKLDAADQSEWVPFIEGLVNSGRISDAKKVYLSEIKGNGNMRFPLCQTLAIDPNYPPTFKYNYQAVYDVLCNSK
ncbi:MAG: hypothetical protein WCP19_07655 [Chloroflexota bacterium]